MEEQANYFNNNENLLIDEETKKLCKNLIIGTIIIDLLFFTLFGVLVRIFFLFVIIGKKKILNPKCYKKILIIWFVPIILILLAFGGCLLIFLPYL